MIAIQRLRTRGQDWSLRAMNFVSDRILVSVDYPSLPAWLDWWIDEQRHRFGWWIDAQLSRVFGFFYEGSDEELLSALRGELPRRYMDARLREFVTAAVSDDLKWYASEVYEEFFCSDCGAELGIHEEGCVCADCRALRPDLLLEDRK